MTTLNKLKAAKSLEDLASVLGYKPSGLSYIVYKLPDAIKYMKFQIPKGDGGTREISAPHPQLKTLQRHLANVLYACRESYEAESGLRPLSHGFRLKHSIITNARPHKRRKYVLNLDLSDFFPSFNFGRVRGFFIKNLNFGLNERVATIIAQIACHENMLPQGSPCSPIISDLIAHAMDVRLAQLAKKYRLTYTRYADDLTFSTSQKEFPGSVASLGDDGQWKLGESLPATISKAGFAINGAKTRMQVKTSRQVVTGLTVNSKVNIRADYYRYARSMCNLLFRTGAYFRPDEGVLINSLNPLEGVLSHIYQIKDASDQRDGLEKVKKPTATRLLYARFLFYRLFVRLDRPLIVCEGKTDNIYLKYAVRYSPAFHPKLGSKSGEVFESTIAYFGYGNQAHKLLQLNGGSGDLKHLVLQYKDSLKKFAHRPLAHPVIVLIDNDDGAKAVLATVKENFKITIGLGSAEKFYHLTDNLYLVKTPEGTAGGKSCIEDFFDPALLKTELKGKKFKPGQDFTTEDGYGKMAFAENVVRPAAATINFSGFAPLLERIVAVIDHYKPPMPKK